MRSYKYRIYPNHAQKGKIDRTLDCCRFVYNHFLAIRRDEWQANHVSITFCKTCKMLTWLKRRDEMAWLREPSASALQASLRDLDTAYQNFFKKIARYPRFKTKRAHQQSFRVPNQDNGIRVNHKHLRLPKIGEIRIHYSREFDGRILNATVKRMASGKYFVLLCVEVNETPFPCGNGKIGLDVGLKEFFSDSNGNRVDNPHILYRFQKKLSREQRRLDRKMPRSKNWSKQRIRVALVHERIVNIRRDFLQKISTRLVSENQVIAIEHLQIKNMMRNRFWAKAVSDVNWYTFFRMLEYKATWRGATVLKVDKFYASSQTCSQCGFKNSLVKNLSIRQWICPQCGAHHDRDTNAAKNILAKAMETLKRTA